MKLREHQKTALDKINSALQNSGTRATVAMACGTGKTLVGIRAAEAATKGNPNAKLIVFAPSLSLLDQLMNDWVRYGAFNNKFAILPVASSGSSMHEEEGQELNGVDKELKRKGEEHGLRVLANTTDYPEVVNALQNKGRTIVFCTYQSAGVLQQATAELTPFAFDFAVMDEAHRTAGSGKKADSSYIMCLSDKKIKIKRRLFLTATPRVHNPDAKPKAGTREADYYDEGYSMDEKALYGEVVHKYSYAEAIADGMLADYRIFAIAISDKDLRNAVIGNDNIDLTGVDLSNPKPRDKEKVARAQNLALIAALGRLHEQGRISGGITFHNTRALSILFNTDATSYLRSRSRLSLSDAYTSHIEGTTSHSKRQQIMSDFGKAHSENRFALLSNCNVLTEGIDVPEMDTVVFADNKTSKVAIVQAVGRAVRLNKNNPDKVASVVIPLFIGEEDDIEETAKDRGVGKLFEILSGLRENDNMKAYFSKAMFRQDSGDSKNSMIGSEDSEGNSMDEDAERKPITIITPESAGLFADMDDATIESYRKFASNCETRMIRTLASGFEMTLAKYKGYKQQMEDEGEDYSVVPHAAVWGGYPLGKVMKRVMDQYAAGTLPTEEQNAYAAEGLLFESSDDIVNEMKGLSLPF